MRPRGSRAMWASATISETTGWLPRWLGLACLFVLLALGGGPLAEARPQRVVSMNLCTDQLAMMVAAPDQLASVTYLADDPGSSAMYEQAREYPVNHGRAEEIYLMEPDLVLAGRHTTQATVGMLERLDIPVKVFDPVNRLKAVPERLRRMGRVLGRQEQAARLVAAFNERLERLRADVRERPRAALYSANGYTSGDYSLAGEVLASAGFDNVAPEAGYPQGGVMPLEALIMAAPEIVITSVRGEGRSRSESVLRHPVFQSLTTRRQTADLHQRNWVCGTPHVLDAIMALKQTRRSMQSGRGG